ncbi:hypothetical protein BJY01DRAFT_228614 [Aspergillus pseudoustus]|uniref:Uncharacterized protein n=1 Tax=Aspergillus pseudoustus TaxID=1810923 RepID=A0ABR4IK32_9EURO
MFLWAWRHAHKTRLSTVIQQLPQLLRLFTWTTSSAFHCKQPWISASPAIHQSDLRASPPSSTTNTTAILYPPS